MPITFYDSLGDFSKSLPKDSNRRAEDWNGGLTFREAKAKLFHADALAASDKLLEQVEADGLELAVSQWEHARTGFIPCVPSYLAGSPESMQRLVDVASDVSPIKIFVDVCLSGAFGARELTKRGTTILALARKLQSVRPVELSLFASMHGNATDDGYGACAIPVVKIDTNPLDLTTVSFAMGSPGFLRQLCFAWGDARGFNGAWAWRGSPQSNRAKLVEYLKVGEQDMLIDGAYATDELMKNPVKWVNDQVRRYASVLEEI